MIVTAEEHAGMYRILVDGEDISKVCRWADDVLGLASCFRLDEKGQMYMDVALHHPAVHLRRGKVEILVREK